MVDTFSRHYECGDFFLIAQWMCTDDLFIGVHCDEPQTDATHHCEPFEEGNIRGRSVVNGLRPHVHFHLVTPPRKQDMQLNAKKAKNEADVTGSNAPLPGRYIMKVMTVDETFRTSTKAVVVEMVVMHGLIPGQTGIKFTERLWLDDDGNPQDSHLRFALATGIMAPGTAEDVALSDAIGREFVVQLELKKNKASGDIYTNIAERGMAMWSLSSPAVADVIANRPVQAAPAPAPAPAPQYAQPAPAPAPVPAPTQVVHPADPYGSV